MVGNGVAVGKSVATGRAVAAGNGVAMGSIVAVGAVVAVASAAAVGNGVAVGRINAGSADSVAPWQPSNIALSNTARKIVAAHARIVAAQPSGQEAGLITPPWVQGAPLGNSGPSLPE